MNEIVNVASNEIERCAITQARNIAEDPSLLLYTRMRVSTLYGKRLCEWCDNGAYADYECRFDVQMYAHESLYWLCPQHKTRCEILQSTVLTDNVIARRLKVLGLSFNKPIINLCQLSCIMCYTSTHRYYSLDHNNDQCMCVDCKQQSDRLVNDDVMRLLLLSTLVVVDDINRVIARLMLHYT